VMRRVQDISEDENMEIEKQLKRLGYL